MTPTRRGAPLMAGRIIRVPGRIEVLGKHVDYAGGRGLLCAIDRGFTFEVRPRGDGRVTLHDRVSDQRITIDPEGRQGPGAGPATGAGSGRRGPVWARYPRAVVRRVRRDFFGWTTQGEAAGAAGGGLAWTGCDIGFTSDLPSAAGLSSSSAFTAGILLSIDAVTGLLDSDAAHRAIPSLAGLADYMGAIESGRPFEHGGDGHGGDGAWSARPPAGVGVRSGSQDATAILCSRAGSLLQASFAPVSLERYVELPPELEFVIGVSGVRASKAGGARARYNRLSDAAKRIAELWRARTGGDEPHLGAILASGTGAGTDAGTDVARAAGSDVEARLRDILERDAGDDAPELIRRVEQFRTESFEIVPAVADALATGDLAAVGEGVATSQRLAETHLGNQVPETVHLAAAAREIGAVAASSFGAGFGGAVWALVQRSDADAFVGAWREGYREAFPRRAARARFEVVGAADPAGPLPSRFGAP